MDFRLTLVVPRPTDPPRLAQPRALRRASAGLALGGALLLIMYALQIVYGLEHGRLYTPDDVTASPMARLGLALLTLALLAVALGLFTLGRSLRGRAPILAVISMALASVAFALMPINLAFLSGLLGPPRHLPRLMLPVLTNLAATVLLSVAALRSRALPAGPGYALLAAGVITFPFILLTIPLEAVVPDYLIADLPFAAWGATLLVVGWLLRRGGRAPSP
jgi:hypothetical protein